MSGQSLTNAGLTPVEFSVLAMLDLQQATRRWWRVAGLEEALGHRYPRPAIQSALSTLRRRELVTNQHIAQETRWSITTNGESLVSQFDEEPGA